jgi:hypothetical protein
MITDLNNSIKQLLIKNAALDTKEVDIIFDVPNREWSSSISKPTINLYLYDMRENHELRKMEWSIETDKNGMATRKKSANRIDLSYLVTVWANNIEDQHRLLWRILLVLFQNPVIPQELLSGELAKQNYIIPTTTAQPDGLFSNPSDFWAALDNEIKPSINFVVTLPLDLSISFTSPIVNTTTFSVQPPGTEAEQFLLIKGFLHAAGKLSKPISGATIVAVEANMTAVTDENGHYIFPRISEGKYTFQILVDGKKQKEVKMNVPDRNYDIEV